MNILYGWVKNIVAFYILMTAVLHLLPKSSYQKYVRFFGGLLLVVLLLTPILQLFKKQDTLLDHVSYESFRQQMDTIQLDTQGLEQHQRELYQKEYGKAIGGDITLMAEEEGLTVQKIQVELTEDYEIATVTMHVSLTGQQDGIFIEKITLKDNSREYPAVLKFKEKLMDFYKIGESQIQITVKEE